MPPTISPRRRFPRDRAAVSIGLLVLTLGLSTGCGGGGIGDAGIIGGSAGVRNGGIVGNIRGVGDLGTLPILGAFVTARQVSPPGIIRSTRTDANGDYVLTDLPVGPYTLSVSANGFASLVEIADVYVESGGFSTAPPIFMQATIPIGSSNLVVNLLDAATGEPIPDATVSAGVATTSLGPQGVYNLSVPSSAGGVTPPTVPLRVDIPGYDLTSLYPSSVTIVPGQVIAVTATLTPLRTTLSGRVRVSVNEGFYLSTGALSTVSVQIPNISPQFTQGAVNPGTGEFRLLVPVSTREFSRRFSLTFVSPLFNIAVVTGVTAPLAGERRLDADVVLTPIGVEVTGQVLTSSGMPASSGRDQVTIAEIGRSAPIVGGTYTFTGVPTGFPMTLRITAFNPLNPARPVEQATLKVQPLVNSQGVFVCPTVTTF